jgi:type IV fimbrial biogenesis protein FimT
MQSSQNGLTMIELMVGLVIVAILLATGVPSFRDWMQNSKIRTASESILNGLQLARAEAVKRNTQVQFVLLGGSSWNVGCVTVTATCLAMIQSRSANEGSTASIIVTPEPVGANTVVFNNFGAVVATATTPTQFNLDVPVSIMPAADSRDLRITIGVGGNSRMCDPNLASSDPRAC